MQKRNAIFVRYALAGGLARVPCGCCAFLRGLCSCEVSRPTRFYYVTLTLNPSPRGRDLPSPSGLYGSRSLCGRIGSCPLRVLCSFARAVLLRGFQAHALLLRYPHPKSLPSGQGLAVALRALGLTLPPFAGGLARVPCGCCAFLRELCSCEVSRPTRFYYVTLTLNPSPRGRDLLSPFGL